MLLLADGIGDLFFNITLEQAFFKKIGVHSFTNIYFLFIQFYILIIVAFEIGRTTTLLPKLKLNPAVIFMLSFVILILIGTLMLILPEMTVAPGSMPLIDAFFTSTSATCVTGLIVVDTATYFSFKGHIVIMTLLKLGGLNIIAFGTFFALISKFGVGIKHHAIIEDFVNKDSILSSKGLIGRIIVWSFFIEFVGTLAMYFAWDPSIPFETTGDKIFSSFFHSFSAFNNAGFTLFTGGLYNEYVRHNYMIHLIVTVLVFFGALGFMTIFDLFALKKLQQRLKYSWKHLQFSSRIALYFSLALVVLGAVMFFILERNNTLADQGIVAATISSVFQSVTRTSGFNTVDISALSMPMLILMLFLMFVGGSSNSTGGGIKTSTFALLYASVVATITGKKQAELFRHSISNSLMSKAFAVLLFFIVGTIAGIFLLSITEAHILAQESRSIMDIIFEEVSAIGTVGLSMGITPELSSAGKIIIMLSMLIGRVGTLTVAFSFGKRLISSDYKYPEGHTMLG